MMESGCILNINRNQVKIDVLVGDEKSIAINTEWRKGGVRITSSAQPRRVAPSKRYSGLRARIQKNLRPTNKSAPPRHLLLRVGRFHCAPRPWRAAPLIALRPLFFDFVSDLQAGSTSCPIRRSIPVSSDFLHRALRRPIHWRELVTLPAVY